MFESSRLTFPFPPTDLVLDFTAPWVAQITALLLTLDAPVLNDMRRIGRSCGGINYVVDVGACVGGYTISYVVAFPRAKILAIEPSKYNYPHLEHNCKQFPNITTKKIAAHNQIGTVEIAQPSQEQRDRNDFFINTGLISVHGQNDQFRETVEADTLDNIVEQKVDWLKIDVEGHEQAVLEGATRILREDRPVTQIELRPENQDMGPYSLSGIAKIFAAAQYIDIFGLRNDRIYIPVERLE